MIHPPITSYEALERLREGNRRFMSDERSQIQTQNRFRRAELADDQSPFAIILSCSDSRVPPEIIFDQGLGDLFVVRVAGSIADTTQIGSIEFAAERLGPSLIVVLGHSNCGAIQATLDQIRKPKNNLSKELRSIIEPISRAIQYRRPIDSDRESLVQQATRANTQSSVDRLRRSRIIQDLILSNRLAVIGAEYSLETGVVDFFESVDRE